MRDFNANDFRVACRQAAAGMREAENELNAADSRLGDGDTGQTMRRVAEAVEKASETAPDDLGGFFRNLGLAGTSATGSSLGTLVSIGLLELGKIFRGHNSVSVTELADALATVEAAMLTRGNSQLGDKTAIDVLHAVRGALQTGPAAAAAKTLEEFRDRPCRIGRARMFAERSIGMDDPGMLAFVRLVQAVAGSRTI